jgi:hypothetical protein
MHMVFRNVLSRSEVSVLLALRGHRRTSLDRYGNKGLLKLGTTLVPRTAVPTGIRRRLWAVAKGANDSRWCVQVTSRLLQDAYLSLRYTKRGDHISTHVDYDQWDANCVKLTALALLEDRFTGAELQIDWRKVHLRAGDVVVFPGYAPHSVAPLRSGSRTTFTAWYLGKRFK